jgi:hypothetical protein
MSDDTVEDAMVNLRRALKAQLGTTGVVALYLLQKSPYLVTYRGQPLDQVLWFADHHDKAPSPERYHDKAPSPERYHDKDQAPHGG